MLPLQNRRKDRFATRAFIRALFSLAILSISVVAIASLSVRSRASIEKASGISSKSASQRINHRISARAAGASAANMTLPKAPAPMAAITVDRTDDAAAASACTAAGTDCSLRGAVDYANSNPGTTIIVPAGTYVLSIPGGAAEGFNGENFRGDLDVTASGTTISGAGAASTIIRQSQPNDRVIEVNPFLSPSFNFSISDVTVTNGHETTAVGGGGMIGGSLNNVTTITNCIFSGNSATGAGTFGGGGLLITGGNLTISGSTISGNSTSASGGGLAYSAGDPSGSFPSSGVLTVTDSTFTNNTAASVAAGGGAADLFDFNLSSGVYNFSRSSFSGNTATNGGAIIVESGGPLTITTSSFAGNSASNFGGAIFAGGNALSVKFSRLVGNTVPIATQGLTIFSNSGTVDANDDWWGVNAGPGVNSARDTAGAIPIATWLQLQNVANPNTVCTGGTSNLTADIKKRNVGPDLTVELNGLPPFPVPPAPVFGNAILGTLSAVSTQYVNGSATATYTAGATPGTGSADAFADGESATAIINIQGTTATTPADQTVCQGTPATFSTTAGGVGPFHYAWTVDGSPFDGDNPSITVPTGSLSIGAHPITVTVTGTCNSVTRNATLTVQENTSATTPADQTVCEGGSATFSTTASGTGPFTYAWTVDGSPFGGNMSSITVSGASAGSHPITVTVTGACNSVTKNATLTVNANTSATTPADQTVCKGATASFSTTASGADLHYAWTVDGSSFNGDSPSINVPTGSMTAGNHPVTVTVTGACGSVTNSATLTVQENTSASTPGDQTVCKGATASFSTTASGTDLHYAWTVDGSPFNGDSPSINVPTGSMTVGNHPVTVTVTGTCGSVTKNATLTVQANTTTTDPADQTVCKGATANFSTIAGGTGPFHYAWTVDGSAFGGDTSSISVPTGSLSVGNHTVAVTTTGTCGSASQSATLTVNANTSTTDPPDQTVCKGATANFSTTASGTGPFHYSWTVDGSLFGGDTSSISVPTGSMTVGNHTVAVTTTGTCGSASQSATLTVNANTATTDPPDRTVCQGSTTSFTTTASGTAPFSFVWKKGVTVLTTGSFGGRVTITNTATTSTLTITNVQAADAGAYTVETTGACGTATQSSNLTVNTTPPGIVLNGNNIELWPPNHSYHTINVTNLVASASSCDGTVNINSVVIDKVTSDEVENGNGDGNTNNDIVIACNRKSVQLRSERDGSGDGRVYTITFKVTDSFGVSSTVTAKVTVPKSQNGNAAVDSGVHYTVTNATCP